MCSIPPAPPLPPPTLPPIVVHITHSPRKSPTMDVQRPLHEYSDCCVWASDQPQLLEACAKNNICVQKPPLSYKYTQFEPILQVGPTCGLAALSMIVKGKVTAEEMLNIAKLEGLSNNGEMFSCKYMAQLAEKVFNQINLNSVKCCVKTGGLFSRETIDKLLKGDVLLVPYDADCNHSPCLKKGHTAHWGLVCGIIVTEGDSTEYLPDNVYVLSRHGKSKYLAAWKLEDLEKSNKNLWEFSRRRGDDGLVYILPEGGVGGENGLRDQYLMFEGISNGTEGSSHINLL